MPLWTTLLVIGILLLAGLVADSIGRRTLLPRVTVLMLIGVAAGRSGFDILPEDVHAWFELLALVALAMVSFHLGSSLRLEAFRAHGRLILAVSLSIVLVTQSLVAAGLWAVGMDPAAAIVMGAIATATAPAATADAIRQAGPPTEFGETLRGIVAIDDAWGLLAFSLALAAAHAVNGAADFEALRAGLWEIGGALALGTVIGLPAARLTGRLSPGEPMQAEALGLVFLTAGLALWLEVSFLIAGMTVGALIANLARHHRRPFHEIEHFEWPFMIVFFFLAGASLEIEVLWTLGWVGVAFLVLRAVARLAGGWVGAAIGRAPAVERPWYGVALMPQAGVAIGMALVAAEALPGQADIILGLAVGSTVVFELIGPLGTIHAVRTVRARRAAPPPERPGGETLREG